MRLHLLASLKSYHDSPSSTFLHSYFYGLHFKTKIARLKLHITRLLPPILQYLSVSLSLPELWLVEGSRCWSGLSAGSSDHMLTKPDSRVSSCGNVYWFRVSFFSLTEMKQDKGALKHKVHNALAWLMIITRYVLTPSLSVMCNVDPQSLQNLLRLKKMV